MQCCECGQCQKMKIKRNGIKPGRLSAFPDITETAHRIRTHFETWEKNGQFLSSFSFSVIIAMCVKSINGGRFTAICRLCCNSWYKKLDI